MSVQSLQGPNGFTQGHCKVHIGGPVGTIKHHTDIKCLQGLYISGPPNIDWKTQTSTLGGPLGDQGGCAHPTSMEYRTGVVG